MSHKRIRAALIFAGTLGFAAVALGIWAGVLHMPFNASTQAAPSSLDVSYGAGAPAINATNLAPQATDPPALGVGDWSYGFPRVMTLGFTSPGANNVTATMQLVPAGTPEPDLLEAIHWRLGWATSLPGLPASNAWAPANNAYTAEGTLADLAATGYVFPATFTPATTALMKLSFWLDPDAPQSVAGQSFTGTLDVTTVVAP